MENFVSASEPDGFITRRREIRDLSTVDLVGALNDCALCGLTKHLGEPDNWHKAACDDIGKGLHTPSPLRKITHFWS
jgi:hypothetical protein